MKIIVIGAGKVGSAIASSLCDEDHDVTIIDKREELLDDLMNEHDIQAVCGNGIICDILSEAEVAKTDLVIATTGSDEINLLCCVTASKMGAKHSIARVRDPSYMRQIPFMRAQLGLSMTVNPEFQAALEISRMLRFPSVINIESYANNRVDLIEIKVGKDSKLSDLSLSQLNKTLGLKVLVCAIHRGDQAIIPKGNVTLKDGDKIHLTASHADLNSFFRNLGIIKNPIKNVMIVGGGKIAHYLASQLGGIGMKVKIIENNEQTCNELAEMLPKATIIHGDGTKQEILLEEGIETTDACVSLTGIDEENMIISLYAQKKNVRRVITKINRSALISLAKSIEFDNITSPKATTVNAILQYVRGNQNAEGNNIRTLHKIIDGKAEALEFFMSKKTKWMDIPLKDLQIRDDAIIAGIVRANSTLIPDGNDVIKLNDNVIVVTTNRRIDDIDDIFKLV